MQDLVAGEFFEQYSKSIAPPGEVANHVDVPEMQMATTISQVFLGIQLKCASCHDSFVDRWKLEDAWGFAAALGDGEFDIYRCELPTDEKATPRFPLAGLGKIDPESDAHQRRRQVATLMTTERNGLFARTIVNRIWARLFGRGLIEPLDEMMEHEPWDSDLLDWLSHELIRQKYDLRDFLVLITTSQAYQATSVGRRQAIGSKDYSFRGPEIRRLTAEQFCDCITSLRRTGESSSTIARPRRAWELENDRLMRMLGRPSRDVVVTMREQDSTPLLALELINGGHLKDLVDRAAASQLKRSDKPDEIISRVFRVLLGRDARDQERLVSEAVLGEKPDKSTVSDLIWTIVMLPEFQLIQ